MGKKALLLGVCLLITLTVAGYQPAFTPSKAQTPKFLTSGQLSFLATASAPIKTATPAATPSRPPLTPAVSPIVGAQTWLKALNAQDETQIQNLTCQAQKEKVRGSSGWAAAFPPLAKLSARLTSQIQVIVAALQFETIRQNEGEARVRVYGNLPITGSGLMAVYGVDERWWMVYEGGVWQWCGTSPGEATPTLTPTLVRTPQPIPLPPINRTSSPSFWQILGVILGVLGGIARLYSMVQRNRNKTG